jgi:hypothetical protein
VPKNPTPEGDLLTPRQVARILGVTLKDAEIFMRSGEIESVYIGSSDMPRTIIEAVNLWKYETFAAKNKRIRDYIKR